MIYLDNAATTLRKPPEVARAILSALEHFGNSGRGAHDSALETSRTIYDVRERIARLLGCPRPDHVCFTANATEALNIAIAGLFHSGDHVLSTDWEHNSVLRPLYRFQAQGGSIDFLPADSNGRLDLSQLEQMIRPNTRGIVCTHASNLTGDMIDLQYVGAIARRHGLLFIADTSQTAGACPIDMETIHTDVICFTGHKSLMGPQGTGGLCIRDGVEIRPWKVGGTGVHSYLETQPPDYPTRLEAGTLNGHGLSGLGAALEFLERVGIKTIQRHELSLSRRFYDGVRNLPCVTVYGDFSQPVRAPIVTLNIGSLESGIVSDELSERWGICTRSGAHCAPRLHRALGTVDQGAVRFSWSWYNTEEETDIAIEAVQTLCREAD